jgi:glycosyltransferase involved in cell wall biosynthesis
MISQKVIVAMPAFNEEKYIGSLLLRARQYASELLVVDDGGSDHTAQVAELAGATVVKHPQNMGYGCAIRTILVEAKKRNADVLVILDADAQHNPDEIPALVKAVTDGADVVIGSRVMQNNNIPAFRRAGQTVLAGMTNFASKKKLSDTESGFRAYSRRAISDLELHESGMAISSEIVSAAAAKGLKISEVPISVTYAGDTSTLNPVKHGLGVLARISVMISERRPLMFFGACGILCILGGVVMGLFVLRTLYSSQILQMGSALLSMLLITVGILNISTGLILSVLVRRIARQ